ncbi:hypothetical protein GN244_ATG03105 [Phytophthora infestans]|nr:hypothetical protein GN244_ATG03105 [Phytophthora infestans]KAF4148230.1 hypothetical protein GN958_ATG02554 [Phytophthora infestans]
MRLVTLVTALVALATPSQALEVSVCGDATYDLPEDRGVICASADPVPQGTSCPLKGDKASVDCFENLPSYDSGACVAPEDAVCALVNGKTWGCVLPSVGCGGQALTTAAPASPVNQCETWDYDEEEEEASASSIDAESFFDGNEDYDDSWFVEVTKVTVVFACGTENPTAAPTSEPTPAPTSVSDPTPAPSSDSTNESASELAPETTSVTEGASSSDSTGMQIQDSGDASMSNATPDGAGSSSSTTELNITPAPTSSKTDEFSPSFNEDGSASHTADPTEFELTTDTTNHSAFESTPAPSSSATSDATDSSEWEPTPAPTSEDESGSDPMDTTGSSTPGSVASIPGPSPAPTSGTTEGSTTGSSDAPTPAVTPAATKSEANQGTVDTQYSMANEVTDDSTATKQSAGFTDVQLLSEPSNFIGTLKPAAIPDTPKLYDKPSR